MTKRWGYKLDYKGQTCREVSLNGKKFLLHRDFPALLVAVDGELRTTDGKQVNTFRRDTGVFCKARPSAYAGGKPWFVNVALLYAQCYITKPEISEGSALALRYVDGNCFNIDKSNLSWDVIPHVDIRHAKAPRLQRISNAAMAELLEQSRARELLGLPPIQIKIYSCSFCGDRYESPVRRSNCGCVRQELKKISLVCENIYGGAYEYGERYEGYRKGGKKKKTLSESSSEGN